MASDSDIGTERESLRDPAGRAPARCQCVTITRCAHCAAAVWSPALSRRERLTATHSGLQFRHRHWHGIVEWATQPFGCDDPGLRLATEIKLVIA